jgi:hypothetical protein
MSNNITILFNNGSGGVTNSPMTVSLSPGPATEPVCIAGGSFNNDGQWDFVVVNSMSNTISVLLGLL